MISAQRHISAWATNCQDANQDLWRNFQPPWPISQTLRWKNAIFTCIWNHFVLQNGELSFSNGRNSISRYFFSQNPKCQFILFQYTNVYLCGDLKPIIDENWCPQILTCFWARRRNNIPQGYCNFLSTNLKCFINVNRSSWSTDCVAEDSKPQVMLRDQRGDQPSTNWENLDFSSDSARVLAFSSQRHTQRHSMFCGLWQTTG